MSVEAITWALKQPVPSSTAKFVLVVLANCASGDRFMAFPSIAYIAEATGQDRKTVLKNMAKLREWDLIEDTGKRTGTTQQVVIYRVKCGDACLFDNSPKNGTVPFFRGNSPVFPPKQSQKRDTETSVTVKEAKQELAPSANRGTRLKDGWAPSDDLIRWAAEQGSDAFTTAGELAEFLDYWKSVSGAKGVKLDWDATFRNWIRTALKRQGNRHEKSGKLSAAERTRAHAIAGERADAERSSAAAGDRRPYLVGSHG